MGVLLHVFTYANKGLQKLGMPTHKTSVTTFGNQR